MCCPEIVQSRAALRALPGLPKETLTGQAMGFGRAGRWLEVLESRQLLSAGDLDPAFGKGGIAYYGDSFPAVAMAIDPVGRIVVAEPHGIVERFNADGTRD